MIQNQINGRISGVFSNDLTRIQDFTELYTFLYEKVDEYGGNNTSNIILILSESQHKD